MVSLHDDCIYFVSAPSQHAVQAEQSGTLDQNKFRAFKTYQKEYVHRLYMLREAERLVPVVAGSDKTVPKVKISHEGPANKALPSRFFDDDLSCIFTSAMIERYDKLNQEFAQRMKRKSWPRDLADLILLDIQFLKGCEIEWKPREDTDAQLPNAVGPLADVGPAVSADDDAPKDAEVAASFEDAAFDFTKWDIYNEGSIPIDRFKFSRDASLAYPRHFAAAGLVLLNTDRSTSKSFKDLKFIWEKRNGTQFEGRLQEIGPPMIESRLANWSATIATHMLL